MDLNSAQISMQTPIHSNLLTEKVLLLVIQDLKLEEVDCRVAAKMNMEEVAMAYSHSREENKTSEVRIKAYKNDFLQSQNGFLQFYAHN